MTDENAFVALKAFFSSVWTLAFAIGAVSGWILRGDRK